MQSFDLMCAASFEFLDACPANAKSMDAPCPGLVAVLVLPSPLSLAFTLAARHAGQFSRTEE